MVIFISYSPVENIVFYCHRQNEVMMFCFLWRNYVHDVVVLPVGWSLDSSTRRVWKWPYFSRRSTKLPKTTSYALCMFPSLSLDGGTDCRTAWNESRSGNNCIINSCLLAVTLCCCSWAFLALMRIIISIGKYWKILERCNLPKTP